MSDSFDSFWEDTYAQGQQLNKYPYDQVVSFVFRHAPRDRKREEIRILEVGCGAGNNLWFTAKEGFDSYGIDASQSAIAYAQKRFDEEGLACDLRVADFTDIPFPTDHFDIVIDRGAITETGFSFARKTIREIHRVLKENGLFYFNPYSKSHISYKTGKKIHDGLVSEITHGLIRAGTTCFYDKYMIEDLLNPDHWSIQSIYHKETIDYFDMEHTHAEWEIHARAKK